MENIDLNNDESCELYLSKTLGYKPQKTIIYNQILPFSSEIPNEIIQQLKAIKENLSKSVVLRDIRPSCIHWVTNLTR